MNMMHTSSIHTESSVELPAYCTDVPDMQASGDDQGRPHIHIACAPKHTAITIRFDGESVDYTPNLESIRRRLGDVATCRRILQKTKSDLLNALESLHLDCGDFAESNRAKAFVEGTLPIINKVNNHVETACEASVELLRNLKNVSLRPETPESLPAPSERTKSSERVCVPTNATSLTKCLSEVQVAAKVAIETLELKTNIRIDLTIPVTIVIFLFVFSVVMALFALLVIVAVVYRLLTWQREAYLKRDEREQVLRYDVVAALKKVHLISTHVVSLHIEEKMNSELTKTEPFGPIHSSKEWVNARANLQDTVDLLSNLKNFEIQCPRQCVVSSDPFQVHHVVQRMFI